MKATLMSLLRCYSLLACFVSHLDALVIRPAPLSVAYATQQGALNLSCTCEDCTPGPCAQIAWYRDNVPIDPSGSSLSPRVINDTSSCTSVLGFAAVQAEQSGWYTCAAADASERTEKDFLVIVNSPPVLVFNFSDFIIYATWNSSIPIPCPVSGVPVPGITWYKNVTSSGFGGTPVSADFIDNVTGSLMISTVAIGSATSDAFLKCTATNGYGEQSTTVVVRFGNTLPTNTAIKTSYNYLPSVLECLNNSSIQASFFWLHNGVPIPVYNRTYSPSEGGYYCCGVNVSETVTMYCTVITQPNSTVFQVAPAPYTSVMAGRTINLVCSINVTNPLIYYDVPALSWLSDDKALANTTTVTVLQNGKAFSYLSILDAQPGSSLVYSCSNGARTMTTNLTVLSGCGISNAVKSSGAEVNSNDTYKNWNFSGSYAANVNGENCFVATYNGSSAQYPSIEQEITGPAQSTKMCISARIRQVGSPMATPMVCLLVVEATNAQRRVTCLAHPFPSSPAWYWVHREISLPDEGIETAHFKLKVVLSVDNPSAATGVAYFDDITISFSDVQPQLFVSFVASLGIAVVLVSCCIIACQLCCRSHRKSGINVKIMKKLTMKLSKKFKQLQTPPQKDSAVPYMTRLVQGSGVSVDEKPFVIELQQTHSDNNDYSTEPSQPDEYCYIGNTDNLTMFIDQKRSNSTAFVVCSRPSPQDKQPNSTDRSQPASVDQHDESRNNATSFQSTSSVNGNTVPVKQLIAAINQPASVDQHNGSRNNATSLRSVNGNAVPEVSVKQLVAAINQSTTLLGGSTVNLVPKATDSTVKTEKPLAVLDPKENVNKPVSGHQTANEPGCLCTAVLLSSAEYEPVDMPEPATIPSVQKAASNSRCASTADFLPAEEYEEVDIPEPAATCSNRQSTKDIKSLDQSTDIYEIVNTTESAAIPHKQHTSVSGNPTAKGPKSLSSATLPPADRKTHRHTYVSGNPTTKGPKSLSSAELPPADIKIHRHTSLSSAALPPAGIKTHRHTSVSGNPTTKDPKSLSSAALPLTEEYEIPDTKTNSKGQAPTRNKEPSPAEPGSMKDSTYMALITDFASSDGNTYDSVVGNNPEPFSDDDYI